MSPQNHSTIDFSNKPATQWVVPLIIIIIQVFSMLPDGQFQHNPPLPSRARADHNILSIKLSHARAGPLETHFLDWFANQLCVRMKWHPEGSRL